MDPLIFTADTKKAINLLQSHVKKGCLEHIPPGAGTNRNERLHKMLNNSAVAVPRIGAYGGIVGNNVSWLEPLAPASWAALETSLGRRYNRQVHVQFRPQKTTHKTTQNDS